MAMSLNHLLNLHPFVGDAIKDKIRGTVVGSALGDAIGLYTEFINKQMAKDAYPDAKFSLTGDVTKFCSDSHRNKFVEGSWTDDTDHALLIILSYLHSNGKELSPLDFAQRLKTWIEQGLRCLERLPLGLGSATGSIVANKTYTTDPKAAAYKQWANSNYTSAPNGSLMRTYPLGIICVNKTPEETFDIATDFSLVTHADPRCVVACCIATAIIRGILLGEVRSETDVDAIVDEAVRYMDKVDPSQCSTKTSRHESINNNSTTELSDQSTISNSSKAAATITATQPPPFDKEELYRRTKAESYTDLQLDDLRKQGYVYKCLGASIFCLRQAIRRLSPPSLKNPPSFTTDISSNRPESESKNVHLTSSQIFEDIITNLVMEGGDADTNAAVAGSFLGAYLGFNNLPSHWYRGLRDVNWLLDKTDALVQTIGIEKDVGSNEKYVGSADRDTAPDGGKGYLTKEELDTREKAFMEVYLRKTIQEKNVAQHQSSSASGLIKKWKGVFG